MRYVRIFLLHFQYLYAHRGRPVIYFFVGAFSSLLFLAFMRGAFQNNSNIGQWNLSTVTSYYFLLIIVIATLRSHAELPIVRDDIEKGELAGRLLKPFPYYWLRFFHEVPVRIFEGFIGVIIWFALSFYFNNFLQPDFSIPQIGAIIILVVLSYMISFTFKMIVGITALWTNDIRGLEELVEITLIIFSGQLIPIDLLPGVLEKIAYLLPFSYFTYFPVIALQGKLSFYQLISVVGVQIIWLVLLSFVFRYLLKRGLRRFTDLGH